MNAGPTAIRVYEDLRAMVVSGDMRPGAHLDPTVIAPQLASSTTPVREALNRLMGEGLVEARQGSGFSLPLVDSVSLKDVLCWVGEIAQLALRSPSRLETAWPKAAGGHAESSATVFNAIASASRNGEHRGAMQRCNDRLHAIRAREFAVLEDAGEELLQLEAAMRQADRVLVRRLVSAYVRRRCARASQLVRLLYHN